MKTKQKRGQFFLIASLIIITIIFSFGVVYISAKTPSSESESANYLARSIKYESIQIINQAYYNNATANITANVLNITYYYSISYPEYNITLIHGNVATQFKEGIASDLIYPQAIFTSENITLDLNNIKYTFNVTKGYNVFVLVNKEGENEKYIATA